jgi:hypothetical protein
MLYPFALTILCLATFGCATEPTRATAPPAAGQHSSPRPTGIALDPSEELPRAKSSGESDEALLTLLAPRERSLAQRTVEGFFAAVLNEDPAALNDMLLPEAQLVSDSGQRNGSVLTFWTRRFEKLDYTTLSPYLIYARAEIRSYRIDELDALGIRSRVHLIPKSDELLLVVPIVETGSSGQRKFGDTIEFTLAPAKDAYKIRAVYEDFRLP